MKIELGRPKEIVKIIKEPISIHEFKEILKHCTLPIEIINTHYSEQKPLWVITNLQNNKLTYYATSWANKSTLTIHIHAFYDDCCLQGLENCYINDKKINKNKINIKQLNYEPTS
jgi:hypothetical protein